MKIKRGILLLILLGLFVVLASMASATFTSIASLAPADGAATNNNTLTFNFTPNEVDGNATVDCELFIDNVSQGLSIDTSANVSGNLTLNATSPGLANGTRIWYVNCTADSASDQNSSANFTLWVDTTVPTNNITGPTEPDGNNTNYSANVTHQINFSVNDTLSVTLNYTIRVDGIIQVNGNITNDTNVSADVNLSNGTHEITVQINDNATNFVNSTILVLSVDQIAPNVNFTPSGDNYSNTSNYSSTGLQINFTLEDNLSLGLDGDTGTQSTINYTIYVDGTRQNISNYSALNGTVENVNLTGLANGTFVITVESVDQLGNRANFSDYIISVDNAAPTAIFTNHSNTSTIEGTAGVQINFTLNDLLSVGDNGTNSAINYSIFVDGVLNVSNISAFNNTVEYVNITGLTNQTYNITIEAYDQLSNTINHTMNLTVDQVAPNITGVGPNGTQSSLSVVIVAATNESATCRHSTENVTYGNMTETLTGTDTEHSRTITAVDGANTIFVTCQDSQGNNMTKADSKEISFTVSLSGGSGKTSTSTASSSGGGGGGGSSAGASATAVSSTTAVTKRAYVNKASSFSHRGGTHSVTVDKIDLVRQEATITVASTPSTLTLKVGETKTVDTDGNGKDDLSVTLKKITATFADVELKAISEVAKPAAPAPEPIAEPEAVPVEQAQVQGASSTTVVVIIVVVILAAIIIAALSGKKKRR
jgi:uncharacterized membrane protein YgcG